MEKRIAQAAGRAAYDNKEAMGKFAMDNKD